MTIFTGLTSRPADPSAPSTERLRLAVAAYLARLKGSSREHTESGLRCYLAWCAEHGLDLLAALRPHLELYIRWMQEIRRFKPSTVSRRFSVIAGFYRTCVLDGVLEHSAAEHVRCPAVPPNHPPWASPTCSSKHCLPRPASHRTSATSRWWPCSACLGCGSSRPPAPPSLTSAKNTGTGCCACAAKGTKVVLVPLPPAVGRASTEQQARPELPVLAPGSVSDWGTPVPLTSERASSPGPSGGRV